MEHSARPDGGSYGATDARDESRPESDDGDDGGEVLVRNGGLDTYADANHIEEAEAINELRSNEAGGVPRHLAIVFDQEAIAD